MKKILDFLFHIFRPRHKCKFITCNYGREVEFARLVHSIYRDIIIEGGEK